MSNAPVFQPERIRGREAQGGFAMVLVLAVCAVGVAVLVAFVIRSTGVVAEAGPESAARRASELGALARSQLLKNIRHEMMAGSCYPPQSGESSLVRVQTEQGRIFLLYPARPQTVVPARMAPEAGGFQNDLPNLLKWSSRYSKFYTDRTEGAYPNAEQFPPAEAAAAVSTQSKPAAGRSLREEFWRAPGLLPDAGSGGSGAIPQPDWMLVTSRGERVRDLGAQAYDPVVGRFAFILYDQGGLLDLNVAGFASSLSNTDPAGIERGLKGGLAFADLRVLLQACGVSAGESQSVLEGLLAWRNRGSYSTSGSFSAVESLRDSILGERFGFLGWRPAGDRAFAGRRQLMDFVRRSLPGNPGGASEFLQRVTHFTREIAQPSLYPEAGRPRMGSAAELSPGFAAGSSDWDAQSPFFLEERVRSGSAGASGSAGSAQPDDGALGVRANGSPLWPGEALVSKRFALSRLALLQGERTAEKDALIPRYFGLKRARSQDPWVYRDSDQKPVRILSLAEVAALPPKEAREPDFLELLKAAIVPGALVLLPRADEEPGSLRSVDEALVQIFANLVDQVDADGFPTRILFWDSSAAPEPRVFSGIEHLPYLHRVRVLLTPVRQSVPPSPFAQADPLQPGSLFANPPATDPGSAWVWQDVGVWNPHALSGIFAGPGPTAFRLLAKARRPGALRAVQTQPLFSEDIRIPERSESFAVSGLRVEGEQLRFYLQRAGLAGLSKTVYLSDLAHSGWLRVERGADSKMPVDGIPDALGNGLAGIAFSEVPRVYGAEVPQGTASKRFSVLPSHYEFVSEEDPGAPFQMDYSLEYAVAGPAGVPQWIEYDRKAGVRLQRALWFESDLSAPEFWEFSDPRSAASGMRGIPQPPRFPAFFANRFGEPDVRIDADGVVRRATGAFVRGGTVSGLPASPADRALPPLAENLPVILNRPFRSVAEMAYAWSGLPWRQLDFSIPESPFGGLLDVFSVGETEHPRALEAGRVSLNTRHSAVLEALLYGVRLDEAAPGAVLSSGTSGSAQRIAQALVARTTSTDPHKGPLGNLRDLSGSWHGVGSAGGTAVPISGERAYQGFSADLPAALSDAEGVLRSERARNAVFRALADAAGTRVWNLFVDVVVQTGRYPRNAPGSRLAGAQTLGAEARAAAAHSEMERFLVEAQQHFWWHLAVDRLTGEVIDEQIEPVEP